MNAIKFTVRAKIRITCSVEGKHLRVTVSDQGIGIPRHEIGQLFQLFRPLESGKALNPNGIGLGLYIC